MMQMKLTPLWRYQASIDLAGLLLLESCLSLPLAYDSFSDTSHYYLLEVSKQGGKRDTFNNESPPSFFMESACSRTKRYRTSIRKFGIFWLYGWIFATRGYCVAAKDERVGSSLASLSCHVAVADAPSSWAHLPDRSSLASHPHQSG